MTLKIIALIVIAVLLATDYALLVVASREEERANRMYRKWREEYERGNNKTE